MTNDNIPGPSQRELLSWRERIAREGHLRLGTQHWRALKISRLDHCVDIQVSLRAVREDPSEVRNVGLR